MTRPSVTLFLPACNEEDSLERAAARALKVLARLSDDYELLIVDDASTDRSGPIADAFAERHARVKVVHLERRLGPGGALRSGFSASTKDVVICADAGLPFEIEALERALKVLDEVDADLVCGFRLDRRWPSYAYDALVGALFGVHVRDVNCRLKVMHRRVLEAIELNADGAFIDAELVVKALRRGFRVFPMSLDALEQGQPISARGVAQLLREVVTLYSETKRPPEPKRPVRLPPMVKALRGRKAAAAQ